MAYISKRSKELKKIVGEKKTYDVEGAIAKLKECPKLKFDESMDISMVLGVDPKKSDQQVRGTVNLPHGTGKKMKLVVICKGDRIQEALDAGADFAGSEELVTKIQGGWTDFDALVATPDMMREVGKLGKVLGPRGLMPTPKAGSVTQDVAKAVQEIKAGKVEFKVDKQGSINNALGKISFDGAKLSENVMAFINAIVRAKPSTAKGTYIQSLVLSTTMGPGLAIDINSISVG